MDSSTSTIGETQRSENSTDGKISTAVTNCLGLFRKLLGLAEWPKDINNQSIKHAIQDEEKRFKAWSRNIGADSLDYRLRNASYLQEQVLRLLADLSGLHEDAIAIIRGEMVPWDKLDEEPLREGGDDEFPYDLPKTELGQISTDIVDVVNCLLRLRVSISTSSRFAASANTETSGKKG